MRFVRNFLIFSQEDSGFGVSGAPSGYVKIEAREGRGKLAASVQNLKEDRDRVIYKLYILAEYEGGVYPAYAGVIPLDKNRGELSWEFNPDNVAGTGKNIESFNAAVVLAEYADRPNRQVVCPLAAYKGKRLAWRDKIKEQLYKSPTQEAKVVMRKEDTKVEVRQEAPLKYEEIYSKYIEDIESKYAKREIVKDIDLEKIKAHTMEALDEGPAGKEKTESKEISGMITDEKKENELTSEEDALLATEMENQEDNRDVADESRHAGYEAASEQESGTMDKSLSNNTDSSFDEYRELIDKSINEELYGKSGEQPNQCLFNGESALCRPQGTVQGINPCESCYNRNIANQINAEKGSVNNIENLKHTLDKYFELSDPFGSRRRDYKWWKVNSPVYLNNILFQCNIRTPLLFNPVVITAHFKYRHLIVGIYTDKERLREYIVCGIPGVYGIDDRPFGDMCRWVQLEGAQPKYGAFGYWLVYMDPKTGKFLPLS